MVSLPQDILLVVFSLADGESLLCCCRVCWNWNRLIREREDVLFRSICDKTWNSPLSFGTTWKSVFLRLHKDEFLKETCLVIGRTSASTQTATTELSSETSKPPLPKVGLEDLSSCLDTLKRLS